MRGWIKTRLNTQNPPFRCLFKKLPKPVGGFVLPRRHETIFSQRKLRWSPRSGSKTTRSAWISGTMVWRLRGDDGKPFFLKGSGYNISDHTKYSKFACSYSVNLHKEQTLGMHFEGQQCSWQGARVVISSSLATECLLFSLSSETTSLFRLGIARGGSSDHEEVRSFGLPKTEETESPRVICECHHHLSTFREFLLHLRV